MVENLDIRIRYRFFKEARMSKELLYCAKPCAKLAQELKAMEVDVYSYPVRTFLGEKLDGDYLRDEAVWMDNVALLKLDTFGKWWEKIGKKTRNMVRKAEKQGVVVEVIEENSEEIAEGLWRIYNETPIRQDRWFRGYGLPKSVFKSWRPPAPEVGEFLGAFWSRKLIGFLTLLYGDRVALISQILSMIKHFDKAPNNALIAKAVERCCMRGIRFLIYARMGNHPTLDRFKESNGFVKYLLPRCFLPLSRKGKVLLKLGLYPEPQDLIPDALKSVTIPLYNALSRKLRL